MCQTPGRVSNKNPRTQFRHSKDMNGGETILYFCSSLRNQSCINNTRTASPTVQIFSYHLTFVCTCIQIIFIPITITSVLEGTATVLLPNSLVGSTSSIRSQIGLLFSYLLKRLAMRGRKFPPCWFPPQMPETARPGPKAQCRSYSCSTSTRSKKQELEPSIKPRAS